MQDLDLSALQIVMADCVGDEVPHDHRKLHGINRERRQARRDDDLEPSRQGTEFDGFPQFRLGLAAPVARLPRDREGQQIREELGHALSLQRELVQVLFDSVGKSAEMIDEIFGDPFRQRHHRAKGGAQIVAGHMREVLQARVLLKELRGRKRLGGRCLTGVRDAHAPGPRTPAPALGYADVMP